MAQNSPPISLTLNVLETIHNLTGNNSTPAAAVQIQNASPFIVNVTANGQVSVIQSFTAQTILLPGDASDITILPTNGPAGTQGTLTAVWLQPGEQAAQADGQLTGAAQYAVGLGSAIFGPETVTAGSSGGFQSNVNVPPNARTLIVLATGLSGSTVQGLAVVGNTSLINYYDQEFYLGTHISGLNFLFGFAVVPINALADPVVLISWTFNAANVQGEVTVFADTAQYDESVYYNGVPAVFAQGTNGATVKNGPFRLLSAVLQPSSTADSTSLIHTSSNEPIATSYGTRQNASFPSPGILIPAGEFLWASISGSGGSVEIAAAYP